MPKAPFSTHSKRTDTSGAHLLEPVPEAVADLPADLVELPSPTSLPKGRAAARPGAGSGRPGAKAKQKVRGPPAAPQRPRRRHTGRPQTRAVLQRPPGSGPASAPLAPYPGPPTLPHRLLGDAQHARDSGEHLPHGLPAVAAAAAAAATPSDSSSGIPNSPSLLQAPGADGTP